MCITTDNVYCVFNRRSSSVRGFHWPTSPFSLFARTADRSFSSYERDFSSRRPSRCCGQLWSQRECSCLAPFSQSVVFLVPFLFNFLCLPPPLLSPPRSLLSFSVWGWFPRRRPCWPVLNSGPKLAHSLSEWREDGALLQEGVCGRPPAWHRWRWGRCHQPPHLDNLEDCFVEPTTEEAQHWCATLGLCKLDKNSNLHI